MKHAIYLSFSLLLIILMTITCTEDPAGPGISDDLKPKGNIVGWVYDMWNQPLKDVLVSVDADSSVPCVSDAAGLFKVGQVKEGTYILRFTHRDYEDNPTCSVTVALGVDDTVFTPVQLSYAYYIIRGQITIDGIPQTGAGVCVADYTEGMMTGSGGDFILRKVPKIDSVTLICAYGDIAVKTQQVGALIANDTNDVGAIALTEKGPTVSGMVLSPDSIQVPNITVFAVAGGLKTKTGEDGYYALRNVPANEDGVIIMVNECGYVGAAIGANAVNGAVITGCDIYLKPAPEIINGIKLTTCDIYVPHTAVSVKLRVYPITDVSTVIDSFIWNVGGTVYTTPSPLCPVSVTGLVPSTLAAVTAVSTIGDTSGTELFRIFLTGTAPVIDSIAVSKDKKTFAPAITILEGEWAYFQVQVTDIYGGLTSMKWDFGDGTTWTAPDSTLTVGHVYSTAGTYYPSFTAQDTEGNSVSDSVTVVVEKPDLVSPVLLSPDSAALVHTLSDSVVLQWMKTPGTGIVYNVYMTWSNTIPSEENIIAASLVDSLYTTAVDSGRTYFWRVKAVRTSDNAYRWSAVYPFTVFTNIVNHAPVFITVPDSLTDSMIVGLSYTDTLKASDIDGDALAFTFINFTNGMGLSGNVFLWTPSDADTGAHPVSVRVSDGKGGTDTLAWTITVINAAPVITVHPIPKNVDEYQPATFKVSAYSPLGDSLSWQWQKNDVDIASANDSVYSIDSALCADSGQYRCIVINSYGSDTSNQAKLTVDQFVAEILYVKADATGVNNGASWADAFTGLQPAIDASKKDGQVWVAAGTYKPTKEQGGTGERFKSFSLKTRVSVYGGFVGTETNLNERNWETNVTICSGDIGVVDDSTDNCYHVFYHTAEMLLGNRAVLDGFTVTGGNADGADPHCYGGGMYNKQSRPTINNCVFVKNSASNYGGSMYNTDGASVKMYKCTFTNNYSSNCGGGMYNNAGSNSIITKCLLSANISVAGGGGIYNNNSSPIIDSTTISANTNTAGGTNGGGVYNSGLSSPQITNSLFNGNYAKGSGGAIYHAAGYIENCTFLNNTAQSGGGIWTYNDNLLLTNSTFVSNGALSDGGGVWVQTGNNNFCRIINCTFSVNNTANTEGGGIYFKSQVSDSNDVILNCVFWDNYSGSGSNELYTGNNAPVVIKNTVIQGGFSDTMAIMSDIISTDPLLDILDDNGGPVQTMALEVGSSALDKGLYVYQDNVNVFYNTDGGTAYLDMFGNPYTPVGTVEHLTKTDARGVPRPQGSGIDLGAFEKE